MERILVEQILAKRVSIGRWWFRNRSASPLPMVFLLLLLRPDFEMSASIFFMGMVGLMLAEGLRIWAVGVAGSGTRTRSDDVHRLVLSGPYRLTRNPLYLSNILLYTSISILFGHILLTIIVIGYFVIQYVLIVSYEEELLRAKFGDQYMDYCLQVPRWIIGQRGQLKRQNQWRNQPLNQPVDFKAALRSERSTLIAIAVVGLLWMTRFIWRG